MQQQLHRGAAVTQHRNEEILDAPWNTRMSLGWNPISPFSSNRRQIPTLSPRKSADFTSTLSCPKDTGSSTAFLHRCPSSRTTELSSKTRRRWTIPPMHEFWD